MDAGRLSSQIILKRKTATRNAMGGEVITYVPAGTVSANAEPIRGREYEQLRAAQSETEIRFTIYYREDITPDWRVTWRGQDYDLVSPPIDVKARKEWLELMCRSAQT